MNRYPQAWLARLRPTSLPASASAKAGCADRPCQPGRSSRRGRLLLTALVGSLVFAGHPAPVGAQKPAGLKGIPTGPVNYGPLVTLPNHIPPVTQKAKRIGHIAASQGMSAVIVLKLQNPSGLETLLQRLYTPGDPLFHQYLQRGQFDAQFAPPSQTYDLVAGWAKSQGLTITDLHKSQQSLRVTGTAQMLESAFHTTLDNFVDSRGYPFYAPNIAPALPATVANAVAGIVGLSNSAKAIPQLRHSKKRQSGGLTPLQIAEAYGTAVELATPMTTINGSGQTVALVEFDGYSSESINTYKEVYGVGASTNIGFIAVDGATGTPDGTDGESETELDMEMVIAIAPGLTNLYVYEVPPSENFPTGLHDLFAQVATDDVAMQVSASYGDSEEGFAKSDLDTVETALQQLAAQGQSCYISSGDNGWFGGKGSTTPLQVQAPHSLPHATSVGGTTLVTRPDGTGAYFAETTWNDLSQMPSGGAGGGGISANYPIPYWQRNYLLRDPYNYTDTGVSDTNRNTPDVALNADENSGYETYTGLDATPGVTGGTSASTPLWAGFTACVNQARIVLGEPVIGFISPVLYSIGGSPDYTLAFHDIADYSTNSPAGYTIYAAGPGYDDATGFGSFNGIGLLRELNAPVLTTLAPTSVTHGSVSLLITVTGSFFSPSCVIQWNGTNLLTSFVSKNGLTATVPASLLATAGTAQVKVLKTATGEPSLAAITFTIN